MKILLCNNTLSLLAGSETATYTLALELQKRGHKVSAFSFHLGEVAKKLKENGIEVLDNLDNKRNYFDVVFANHFDPTLFIKAKCPNTPIIFTTHGIIEGPETPPLFCDGYVSVSEEVQKHIKNKWDIESLIIRNAVDTKRFCEKKPRSKEIKNILVSSSYYNKNSETFLKIFDACRVVNATVHATGKDFVWTWAMEKIYNQVDLVITLGRGCLEAMSCNRPVLVIGHWGKNQELSSDGLVTTENIKKTRTCNFSSRALREEIGTKEIVDLINQARVDFDYRKLIKDEHDIKNATDKYLDLADKILNNGKLKNRSANLRSQ